MEISKNVCLFVCLLKKKKKKKLILITGDSSSDESGPDSSTGFGSINVEVIKGEIATLKVCCKNPKNLDTRKNC